MSWVLLSNDDGVDSPALLPFADALEAALGLPVRVCVPDAERSWSSKAVTRRGTVRAEVVHRGDRELVAVDGTPADAVQLGLYEMFTGEFGAAPPRVVVTGINLGYNSGTAFLASSGTVWAGAEAAMAGVAAVAVSTGPVATSEDFSAWRHAAHHPDQEHTWRRIAGVSADVTADVVDSDVLDHCDLVSVNLPWDVSPSSGRTVTQLTPLAYGPLFVPDDDEGAYTFTTKLEIHVDDVHAEHGDGDVAAITDGRVSITPVVLPASARVPASTRAALER